jgi:hypothetical protein
MRSCVDCNAPAEIWDAGIPLCLNCSKARDAAWHPLKKNNAPEGPEEKKKIAAAEKEKRPGNVSESPV